MQNVKSLILIALFSLVTACGGGGGGGSDNSTSGSSTGSGNASGGSTSGSGGSTSGGSTTGGSTGGTNTGSAPSTPATPTPTAQTITLSWTSPSTREDGSALPMSELSGYRIFYYLEESPDNDTVVPVSGGSTRSAQVTLSTSGTYYFAIAAVDNNGLVSNLSNYVSLAVN